MRNNAQVACGISNQNSAINRVTNGEEAGAEDNGDEGEGQKKKMMMKKN